MPAVTFACPECGKVLRSARPIPAGKKITCPTCAAVFPMPEQEDEEAAVGVSDKPRRPVAAPVRDDDDDPRPRRKASRAADDDDEDEPRPRRRSREDDDEDDRPRRKKRKARSQGGSGRLGLLIGAGAVLLLLLAGGGTAAYFIWFHGVNRGGGNEEPLAFVPAGSEVLVGQDYATILGDPGLGAQFEKGLREQGKSGDLFNKVKQETGLEFKELFAQTVVATNLDTLNNQVLMAGGMGGGPPPGMPPGMQGNMPGRGTVRPSAITLIARSSKPFDQKKIVKSCKDADRKSAHGKSYYAINEGDFRTLFMPSNRTLILSSLTGAELDALFASDGTTPSVSADTAALVRGVDKTTLWMAVPFEGKTRAKIDEGLRNDPAPPEFQGLVNPAASGKGVAAWGALEGEQVRIGVNVACADAAAAGQLTQTAEKTWNEQKMKVTLGMGLLAMQIPKTAKVLGELTGSLKFSADGTVARATATTSRANLTAAVQEIQAQNAQAGGGFGGFGPGGPPNPGPPGGFRPGPGKK